MMVASRLQIFSKVYVLKLDYKVILIPYYMAKIFPSSVGCLFLKLVVSFAVKEHFYFHEIPFVDCWSYFLCS